MTAGGFTPRTDGLLAHASQVCASRGARLTEIRRQVLGLILDAEGPTGAYELLDRLRGTRRNAAPPTVYRALDFLLEQGLIHRVERLSAFVGCVSHGEAHHAVNGAEVHEHAAQFLICRRCGQVVEMDDPDLAHALAAAAARAGFTVAKATVEAEGLCAACAGARPDAEQRASGPAPN
jgi:Fur family zinc uptake transcriptional regulator